jgi:ribonuclease P protein component
MKRTVPLKKNFEFMRAYKKGRFFVGKYLILYLVPNRKGNSRLGIAASKKIGKSVRRNRYRRLIKENYRLIEDRVKPGFDMVFVARSQDILPKFNDVKKEMKFLLKRLDVYIPKDTTIGL